MSTNVYANPHGHLPAYPTWRAVRAVRFNDLCLNTSPAADIYDAVWDDVALWLACEVHEEHARHEGYDMMQRADGITDEMFDRIMNRTSVLPPVELPRIMSDEELF